MYTAEQETNLTLWGCPAGDLVCADCANYCIPDSHRVAQDVLDWLVSLGWRVVVMHDGALWQMNLLTHDEFERSSATGAAFPVTAPHHVSEDFAMAAYWLAAQGVGGPG